VTSDVKLIVVNDAEVLSQAQSLLNPAVSDRTIFHVPGLYLSNSDIRAHGSSSAIAADLGDISNLFKVASSIQDSFSQNNLKERFDSITFFGGTAPMLMSEFYILENLKKSTGKLTWYSRVDLTLGSNSIWDILGEKDFDGELNFFDKKEVLPNLFRILKC
jgi:hypothetical protein